MLCGLWNLVPGALTPKSLSSHIHNMTTLWLPCCEEANPHGSQVRTSGDMAGLCITSWETKLVSEQTWNFQPLATESPPTFRSYQLKPPHVIEQTNHLLQWQTHCLNSWFPESVNLIKWCFKPSFCVIFHVAMVTGSNIFRVLVLSCQFVF